MRDRLLLFATLLHGLRVSEAVALHRNELELDRARLWVRRLRGGLSVEQHRRYTRTAGSGFEDL